MPDVPAVEAVDLLSSSVSLLATGAPEDFAVDDDLLAGSSFLLPRVARRRGGMAKT